MKTFIIVTEMGRVRGKVSGFILKVNSKKTEKVADFQFSPQSNRGTNNEAVSALCLSGQLPKKAINASGYIDYKFKEGKYNLVTIEGRGLTYLSGC